MGSKPFHRPIYRTSAAQQKELKEQIEDLLRKGMISESKSPYSSPVMLVPKPGAKEGDPMRLVVDFRKLNEDTIKNRYALPLASELFDRVQGAQYFSKIDLRTGFWQILLDKKSRPLTAFSTWFGHYEYNVLPMGLTNAPATFMHLMNDTFREYLNKFVLVFLDDIVIYSKNLSDHYKHVELVMQRLKDKGLYAKESKCSFCQKEITFLGHQLGADGLKVMTDKVKAINDWPQPKNVKDVRSFLGLANYYRGFIKDFSKKALALTELTTSSNKFKWEKEEVL